MSVEELKEMVRNVNQVLGKFNRFKISFLTEEDIIDFKGYLLRGERDGWRGWFTYISEEEGTINHVYTSGYVDGIHDILSRYGNLGCDVRVLTEKNRREYWYMHDNNVQVKHNKHAHFRMFLALYDREKPAGGFVILGTFDFDKNGLSGTRRDCGIITNHIDILNASLKYFDTVWNDPIHTDPLSVLKRIGKKPST